MIFVTDKGRMANNIFQYGQLYAWGREHGRATMSMRFAHKYPEFRIAHLRYHNTLFYLLVKLAAKLHFIPTVDFDGTDNRQMERLEAHQHVLVTGWSVRFQDLFDKYKDEIVSLFDFSEKVKNTVRQKMGSATEDTIRLGIHIRRGDYATWLGGRFYFNDYQYISVINQFLEMFPGKKVSVFICGNDPKLNQEKFRECLPQADAVYFPGGSPAEDLCLFSECDYLIGPLSTFTLIASMYHDTPLYWMADGNCNITREAFRVFADQARRFDEYFVKSD